MGKFFAWLVALLCGAVAYGTVCYFLLDNIDNLHRAAVAKEIDPASNLIYTWLNAAALYPIPIISAFAVGFFVYDRIAE